MKRLLTTIVFAAMTATSAVAQGWQPTENVELVIGNAAGGVVDRIGRQLQQIIEAEGLIGTTMTVVNKPGAGQTVAVAYMNNHAGDGHFLTVAASSWLASLASRNDTGYTDVTPVINLTSNFETYVVKSDSDIQSVADVVERLKNDPASVSFGLAGALGNPSHVSLAELAIDVGADPTKLKVVAFDSGSVVATQAAGGHIDVGITSASSGMSLIQSGDLRVIGVAAPERLTGALADVPTLREQGIDLVSRIAIFLLGPKDMTAEQLAFWEDVFTKALTSDAFKTFADNEQLTVEHMGSADLPAMLAAQYEELATSPVAVHSN